jgi:RHS repeat-associated protein
MPEDIQQSAANDAERQTKNANLLSPPALNLPKGGGAIRGIEEKFSVNPSTGTSAFSIPLPLSAGRSGFAPQLALSYNSGAGNSPFGLGWSLALPAITRRTENQLPKYHDAEESDIFILSGSEDLVPVWEGDPPANPGSRKRDENDTYWIYPYRPRIEGLFSRIEKWVNKQTNETFWKSITTNNITTFYGQTSGTRLCDPQDHTRIFQWLIEESRDDKGNIIRFEYVPEDGRNVDRLLVQEKNRLLDDTRFANLHLKRVLYANRRPFVADDFLLELLLDYGEHQYTLLPDDRAQFSAQAIDPWKCRHDAFSNFRPGFELRTYRLCQRVLMLHHFAELPVNPCLVRSLEFQYQENPMATYLNTITQRGYLFDAEAQNYKAKSLPPLEFTYSQPTIDDTLHRMDSESMANLPVGLDHREYQWMDYDYEGISGILTEQGDAWFYKRNLGHAQLAPAELISVKPAGLGQAAGAQFMDLAGDNQKCLVQFSRPMPGFYEHGFEGEWSPFTAFASYPNLDFRDPNLKLIDLNNDGQGDILVSEDEVFAWYPSQGKAGFGGREAVAKSWDEEKGPALVFNDSTQSIYLADIVRIRNGEVCYWPNLGYGRFGAKITMGQSPWFDLTDQFNQRFIHLADIDGSGTTDILYVKQGAVHYWLNQSGNSWSAGQALNPFPACDASSSVSVVDLLGTGTACVVWSSPLAQDAYGLKYLDLMGSVKPHLLISVKNNLGHETRLQYAASTKFYLQDKAAGHPWITKLPFPVQVVERTERYDYIAKTKYVSLYAYHHGYYDRHEKEYRGFGMVEQWDTEAYSKFSGAGLFTEVPETAGEEFHLPPIYTKTWMHTGAWLEQTTLADYFKKQEYFSGDPKAESLGPDILPGLLTLDEEKEACRALKGRILRQEIYSQDDSALSENPYQVTDFNYAVVKLQPKLANPYGVFFAFGMETLNHYYERQLNDPRVSHQLVLEVDKYGNALRSASVAYPRRPTGGPYPDEQTQTPITFAEADFIHLDQDSNFYRINLATGSRSFELTGVQQSQGLFTVEALQQTISQAEEIPYEAAAHKQSPQKRLLASSRVLYLKNDLSGPLPFTDAESLGLVYETYTMAFTSGLIQSLFGNRVDADLLSQQGKYLFWDTAWWIPSGQSVYTPDAGQHFYMAQGIKDPFGNVTSVALDPYDFMTQSIQDPLQNTVLAENDYRVLLPWKMTDPNLNEAAVQFDELGLVVATALMGKPGQNEGDTLADPTSRMEYNMFNWLNQQAPNFVHTLAREQHHDPNTRWQETYVYSNGTGQVLETKVQAEPGLAPLRDADGSLQIDAQGKPVMGQVASRWVGNGRTIFNNKGKPVKQYEPFFSATFAYEDEKDLVETGVTPILRYDSLGRLIRTDHPDGTFSKVEFDAWQSFTWDENDTILDSEWHKEREGLPTSDPQRRADDKTVPHANTCGWAQLDVLARTFITRADNGLFGQYQTHLKMDIQGNVLTITDDRGNVVMARQYNMLGQGLYQKSMDAGEQWAIHDVAGKMLRSWDSRGHAFRYEYDALQRPLNFWMQADTGPEIMLAKTIYGETLADAIQRNSRGKVYQHCDNAGRLTSMQYDFKGNLLTSTQQLLKNYKDQADWSNVLELENDIFSTTFQFDALSRPVEITQPDQSVILPAYNEANLLEQVHANLRGSADRTCFVAGIDYDAKGQRQRIEYGHQIRTDYSYDTKTYRLTRLVTTRLTDQAQLQDLNYYYDPVGNITEIQDNAQQTIYFNNSVVTPSSQYTYDPLYRLIQAQGREHQGQGNDSQQVDWDDSPRMRLAHPNDGQAMRNYTENYEYDSVGNILKMIHQAHQGNWTRRYQYDQTSNRLLATSLPQDLDNQFSGAYTYNQHGSMTAMPHLAAMEWDCLEHLQAIDLGGGGRAYYTYDSTGARVRKVVEKNNGSLIEDRIYLGGMEIFRKYYSGQLALLRETLHIIDGQKRIALVETKTRDDSGEEPGSLNVSRIRYQLGNHLGSAVLELDEQGAIISYEEYYPYGNTSYQAGPNAAEVSLKRYRYTGKERDEESGLYYHGARYYAPWLGRWTAADPAGIVDGLNIYTYVRLNPVKLVDSTGMQGSECKPDLSFWEMDKQQCSVALHNLKLWPPPPKTPNNTALAEKKADERLTARLGVGTTKISSALKLGPVSPVWLENALREAGITGDDQKPEETAPVAEEKREPQQIADENGDAIILKDTNASEANWEQARRQVLRKVNDQELRMFVMNGLMAGAGGLARGASNPSIVGGYSGGYQHGAPTYFVPGEATMPSAPTPSLIPARPLKASMRSPENPVEGKNAGGPGARKINCGYCSIAGVDPNPSITSASVADSEGKIDGPSSVPEIGQMLENRGLGSGNLDMAGSASDAHNFMRGHPAGTKFVVVYQRANGTAHAITARVGRFGLYYIDHQEFMGGVLPFFRLESSVVLVNVFTAYIPE